MGWRWDAVQVAMGCGADEGFTLGVAPPPESGSGESGGAGRRRLQGSDSDTVEVAMGRGEDGGAGRR